jgi:hypothetical protein
VCGLRGALGGSSSRPESEEPEVEIELVEVARVDTLMDRTMAESVLEDAGIEFVCIGGQLESTAFPLNQPVSIQVAKGDEDRARKALSCLSSEPEGGATGGGGYSNPSSGI